MAMTDSLAAMANRNRRPNSFGDAAAATTDPTVQQVRGNRAGTPSAISPAANSIAAMALGVAGNSQPLRTVTQTTMPALAPGERGPSLSQYAASQAARSGNSFGDAAAATSDPTISVINQPPGIAPVSPTTAQQGTAITPPTPNAPGARGLASLAQPPAPGLGLQGVANGISSGADMAQRVADVWRGGQEPAGTPLMQAPTVRHSGNDWQARNDLRSARISASSMTNARERSPKTGLSPAETQFANMLQADTAARGAQPRLDQEAMRQHGGLAQQAMRSATESQGHGLKHIADMSRLGLDTRKQDDAEATSALDRQQTGLGLVGMAQQQQALDVLMSPHTSPEDRQRAQTMLMYARGKGGSQDQPQLPTAALKMQQEELDALGIASTIGADLGAITEQLDSGQLNLGPMRNLWNRGRNAIGASTDESRNLASFDATLEKLRNDSLRLNKGVQTEGDAERAWNEVLKNTGDPELVRKRLAEVQRINERAAAMRAANVDQVRQNFGAEPLDLSLYRNPPSAIGQQQPGAANSQADWAALPPGALYTAPDGSIRRKKQ